MQTPKSLRRTSSAPHAPVPLTLTPFAVARLDGLLV